MLGNHQQLVHMLGNHLPTCTHAEQSQITCTCDRNHQQLVHMLGIINRLVQYTGKSSTDLYNILENYQPTCTIY